MPPQTAEEQAPKAENKDKAGEYSLKRIPSDKVTKEGFALLEITDVQKQTLANLCMDQITEIKGSKERKEFIELCDYTRKRYTMEDLNTEWPWEGASKRRTGDTTIAHDRIMPRVMKAFFGNNHPINVEAKVKGEKAGETAAKQERWLNSTMCDPKDMNLPVASENTIFDAIMLNFGILKNPWERDETPREESVIYESADELLRNYPDAIKKYPELVLALTGYSDINKLVKDYPAMKNLPVKQSVTVLEKYNDVDEGNRPHWVAPENMFYAKGTKDDEKCWFKAELLDDVRYGELMKLKKNKFYENVDKLIGEDKKDETDNKGADKTYTRYECEVISDVNDDSQDERVIVTIGVPENASDESKAVFLRGFKHTFIHKKSPWVLFRGFHHRYGFYTGGLGEKLRSINNAEDRRTNQVQNAFDQAVIRAFKHVVIPGSPYNPKKHKFYPGADIPLSDPNELTEMKTSDVPPSSSWLGSDNRREAELLSGVPQHLLSGMQTPGDMEASGKKSELLVAEGMESITSIVVIMGRSMVNIAYQTQCNYYDLNSKDVIDYKINSTGWEDISKDEMRQQAIFHCRTALNSVTMFDKAKMNLALMAQIGKHPILAMNVQAQWILLRSIVSNWSDEWAVNVDELLPPEDLEQLKVKMAQAQAEAERQAQLNVAPGSAPAGGLPAGQ